MSRRVLTSKCLWVREFWRQMPVVVGANNFECVDRYLWLSLSLSLYLWLYRSLSHFFLTFTWWRIAVILALICLRPLLFVSFLFFHRVCLSFLSLARCCSCDYFQFFFLFSCVSVSPLFFLFCRVLSHSDSLSLSFLFSRSLSFFFSSLSLCVSLVAHGRTLLFNICRGCPLHGLRKLCRKARKVFAIGLLLLSLILRTVPFVYWFHLLGSLSFFRFH